MRTNGEKAKQRYSRNLTRSLNKSQEKTTKQHKKVCQPTDLQTEEDFVIERNLLEDADFPLSSTFIDKNVSGDSCSAYIQTESVLKENCSQTDMTVNHLKQLENELLDKSKHNYQLREKIPYLMTGTLERFDSDQKVLFYTGLPNREILQCVFNFVKPLQEQHFNSALTYFQEFSLTLMRLRLNLTITDLAYRYNVSKSTSSNLFLKWIDVLDHRLSHLIKWPDHAELLATMPLTFRKYFETKVAVIIVCFEVFINKPSNYMARACTWSQYKHRNTIKFLISISPQGVISFISKVYGG